jgi:prolyl oligopeptidase
MRLDGTAPTLLYGYGGFDVSLTPSFYVPAITWMEMGGVYAVANLRGGGEFGEDWHQAGMRQNKQNVFDDFIAAAQWLFANGYTSPAHLAIRGRSNGGLLIGATLNQRPDLCRVAFPEVGVMDMLRFQKFPNGRFWVSDYGSSDDRDGFRTLSAYSPLHTIRTGARYPAVCVIAADSDDKVNPAHSLKYTAALQAAADDGPWALPVFIRIESQAGHGRGLARSKVIDMEADKLAFAAYFLGL